MQRRSTLFAMLILLALFVVSITPIAAQEAEAFPVTIEHKFGSTTITEAPQRVVAIGYTEQDYLLALGVTPVAVRYWYGDEENAIFPWATDYVEGEPPVVLNMTFGSLDYEEILSLQPDLISAVTAGISQEEYDLLSEIAPTIAQTDEYIDFGMPWQETMRIIGEAVGQPEEATAIVEEVENLFEEARAENPEFEGKTVAVAYFLEGAYGFYTAQDSRGRFFTELGFDMPEELLDVAGESFYAQISAEQVGLLDQDLIAVLNLQFIEGGQEALEADPLFGQLDAVQEDRIVYLEEQAENALGFSSPLSLAYALDAVLPQLEAIFGDASEDEATDEATDSETVSVTCEEGFRLFEHPYLGTDPVCIPDEPERIAILDLAPLEVALTQGIEPVAMFGYGRDLIARSNPDITVDVMGLTAETADVGNASAVNFEALLESDPDLIITTPFAISQVDISTFEEIAPTVIFEAPLEVGEYRSSIEFMSAVLNTPDLGETLLTQLDERLAAFQEALGDGEEPTEISLVRLRDAIVLWTAGSFSDHLIHEAGLVRPEQQREYDLDFVAENSGRVGFEISEENLPLIDGDNIIVWTAAQSADVEEEARQLLPTLQEDPLWNTLEGVQNDHLFIVGSHWQGFGIFEAQAALDDLFRYVAGVDPQEVAPNPFLSE
ncbi:ABC transporter substrate-binding protein [Phototrophicus methaneseepsis]|uniref:ABC transporter substrate-binding protein n=1 Tax=Phototrophicus methaneseepsis TaxID=2710758 RepID=A0A7S8E6N8_9CHLR|nr:ABC transporter substrate-binding protein [Phototrophicus methaneseepsis]QPC81347.1 ABC transporter substrate-binding protein [Phototrophicus methaneseepsis]